METEGAGAHGCLLGALIGSRDYKLNLALPWEEKSKVESCSRVLFCPLGRGSHPTTPP